ncbi:CPBP family intramembrane metalloprotease [bacterium]|nr:CPBP family intramembrane metalloprotease [bacterium]
MSDTLKEKTVYILKGIIVMLLFFNSNYIKLFFATILNIKIKNISNLNYLILTILSDIVLSFIFYLIYRKELKKDFNTFKNNFNKCFDSGLKYWLIGLSIMVIANILIAMFTPLSNSTNEKSVQSLIPTSPALMFIAAGIFAPIIEEITFRKTFQTIFKNKWTFALISFLVFGYIHVMNSNNPLELLYIVPYGSLGLVFALTDYETNTVFTSIMMHMIHNSMLIILSLL